MNRITDREARGPFIAWSHDAGDLSPGRHRKLIGGDKTSVANLVVHRIDPGRLDSNQHLAAARLRSRNLVNRSEEHRSELQSLMRISYAVFCLKKKITKKKKYMHNKHTIRFKILKE